MNDQCTAQKIKFFIKDFFSKCDQIHRKLRIWSHLLKKSWMENFSVSVSCLVILLRKILHLPLRRSYFLEVFLWINFCNCKRIFAFFSFLDKDSHSWNLHFVGFILLPWSLVPKNIYMVFRTKTMVVVLH